MNKRKSRDNSPHSSPTLLSEYYPLFWAVEDVAYLVKRFQQQWSKCDLIVEVFDESVSVRPYLIIVLWYLCIDSDMFGY